MYSNVTLFTYLDYYYLMYLFHKTDNPQVAHFNLIAYNRMKTRLSV